MTEPRAGRLTPKQRDERLTSMRAHAMVNGWISFGPAEVLWLLDLLAEGDATRRSHWCSYMEDHPPIDAAWYFWNGG